MKMKLLLPKLLVLFVLGQTLVFSQNIQKSLVDQAWEALTKGQNNQAEQLYLKAIEQNPADTRAYLGLALFYKNRDEYDKALDIFRKSLKYLNNPAPFLFAWEKLPKYSSYEKSNPDGSIEFYKTIIKNTDSLNILKSFGLENLGIFYLDRGKYKKAEKYLKQLGSITKWNLIGPFENVSGSGFDKQFQPEIDYEPDGKYLGLNGALVHWFPIKKVSRRKWVFLTNYFPFEQGVYYAINFVYSSQKRPIYLRLGTSGAVKVFLNDEKVISIQEERNNGLDTYFVKTELQKGWNKILLKLAHYDIKSCNFLIRFSDLNGNVFEPEKISLEPKQYVANPKAPVKFIPNFAEEYFKQQIKQHPNRPENYLFLAETYSKNDKSELAEQILKQGLKIFPNNSLFLVNLLEAYIRSQKMNEAVTTMNALSKIDDTLPLALQYQINIALQAENLTQAEEFLNKLQQVSPESENYYDLLIRYYSLKKQIDKVVEYVNIALGKYPYVWSFNLYKTIILQQVEKDINRAIDLNKKYVDKYKEEDALVNLLNLYIQRRSGEDWKEGFEEIIELTPDNPYYYYQLGLIYSGLQDFNKARKYIKNALELCPMHPDYWNALGDVERMAQNKKQAIEAYQTALDCFPKFYEVYPKIRELENKPSYFSYFKTINTDSLRLNAPTSQDFPEDPVVGLLDYKQRIVYKRGATETLAEFMVKVLNEDGVDYFKEYYISANPNFQNAVVEKAVVLKDDGREVNAEVQENVIVFKSLEPSDCIYIKWKTKDYYFGKLTQHFWDDFDFDEYYPFYNKIYALYVEGERTFEYKTKNFTLKPMIKKLPEGKMYEWRMDFSPKIQRETGMPNYEQIGKVLYLSSIPDWKFIANWYLELAGNKSNPTYEIEYLVNEILKGKEHLNAKDKVRLIYNFVTEKIRYSDVSLRQSALIPQKAVDVLSTRLGDCKDKVTLFLAMLKSIGVDANYVLVNTDRKKKDFNYLPSINFDHAIAAVKIDSTDYFLDLTAYNYPMGILPYDDKESFALIVSPSTEATFYLPTKDIVPNMMHRERIVKFLQDNKIECEVNTSRKGRWAASFRETYRNKGEKENNKTLLKTLTDEYQNVNLLEFQIENLDTLTYDIHYHYKYTANNFVDKSGKLLIFKMHWIDAMLQDERLALNERKYPLIFGRDGGKYYEKATIHFPKNVEPVALPENLKIQSPYGNYEVTYTFADGMLTGERTFEFEKFEIMPDDYKDFKAFFTKIIENDDQQIVFTEK